MTSVNEPMWSYSYFTEDELETEETTLANGTTEVKYFVKEKYAEYKNDGFCSVKIEARDDHDIVQFPDGLLIKAYDFK